MFERRLKILLILLALPTVGIAARLVQMQVIYSSEYHLAAEKMQTKQPVYFPSLRGEIQDHEGRRLAYDAPAWDMGVRYEVLTENARYLRAKGRTPEDVAASWQAISRLVNVPVDELHTRGEVLCDDVRRVKEHISNAAGYEIAIPEEMAALPVVVGLDQNQQAVARAELAAYPWVEIIGGHVRRYEGGESVGQLLGYLNEVDAKDIRKDPYRHNDLAEYALGDLHGVAGVEALAEGTLRGLRGRRTESSSGVDIVEPVNGHNYRLTIDLPLQQIVYGRLAEAVKGIPTATGASAVIIDVPSRHVLAVVSYPGYDPNITRSDRRKLEADEKYRPFKFRAIAENYPPGSIVKPIVCAGALTDNKINLGTHFTCYGHLFADDAKRWGCLGHHGSIDPVTAIERSCNVFFYHVGPLLGVPRLSWWMGQVGFGRTAGTGLMEEVRGTLRAKDENGAGDDRYTAIGQGDVMVTPLQAANMVASIASGVYRPVTLWADDPQPRPAEPILASREALQSVRKGMYLAVNAEEGTAYHHIQLTNTGDVVLLGKTGSAEATKGRVIQYIFECQFPDGTKDEILAANETDLSLRFPTAKKIEARPYERFPPDEAEPTHGWFVGYLTSKNHYLDSSAGGRLNAALAVLIEYGGRGGAVAAPVAGEIVQAMIDMQAPEGARTEGNLRTRDQRKGWPAAVQHSQSAMAWSGQ